MSKPGSSRRRLLRLRAKSPAPTSSSRDKATWATTSTRRRRPAAPPTTDVASSFSVAAAAGRVAWSAGARPKTMPVSSATARVKMPTRRSGCAVRVRRASSNGSARSSSSPVQTARKTPAAPPSSESSTLSVRSWRTIRPRPAPRLKRMASSFWRAVARAISRLATFAQATSSTSPTIPMSATSGVLTCVRRSESPLWPGSTSRCLARKRSRKPPGISGKTLISSARICR